MLTLKLHIDNCSDNELLSNYVCEYTRLFYKTYNNPELIYDNDFIKLMLNDYIDKTIYDNCISDVLTKLNQFETQQKNKEIEILNITKQLEIYNFITKRELRTKYNLINKLSKLKKDINKNICFGGKKSLREITKLSQKQNKSDKEINLLLNKKRLFTEKRKIGLYVIGRSCEKGNRKFDFDLNNNKIIFKPNKKQHIEIDFKYNNNKSVLNKLQILSDNNNIPITVRIDNNYIYLTYDEERLNGYSFNDVDCKKEQKNVKNKEEKKLIYIKFKNEQNNRKKINKIENRYLSFDLNPTNIGLVIFDKKNNEINNVYHKELIEFSELSKKLNKNISDSKQVKQNNKRKHEITIIWKYIFKLAKHYKVYNIVMEDLNINNKSLNNKESNRKIKNIWHRELTNNLIKKYSNTNGFNIIEINPAYSSFIGNMVYNYPDAVSSAMEIGRRGIVKYIKGSSIYPTISRINLEKLNYLLGENVDINEFNWIQIYKRTPLLRYRNRLNPDEIGINLYSNKSLVYRYLN